MKAIEEIRQLLIDNPVNLQGEGVEHPYARYEVVFLRDIRKGKIYERVAFGPTFTDADKADGFWEQKQRKVKGVIIYDNSRKYHGYQRTINFHESLGISEKKCIFVKSTKDDEDQYSTDARGGEDRGADDREHSEAGLLGGVERPRAVCVRGSSSQARPSYCATSHRWATPILHRSDCGNPIDEYAKPIPNDLY